MKVTKEQLQTAIIESRTMAQAASKLQLAFSTFKRYAEKYGLYEPNQGGKGTLKEKKSLEDVFSGKEHMVTYWLKKRLIREGYKSDECEECGISEWNGKKIVMELDHIDGNNGNNSLDNLRLLCPNCHSQTSTFRGRNIETNSSLLI